MPFEEFMRRALHDPDHGYYARRIAGIGRSGDFTTAPMLSELPALAIARWAASALRDTGCRDLIEIGPGEGLLARSVWKALPRLLRWKVRFHLVESSVPLARKQREALGFAAHWHEHPAAALERCDGNAVIFSNELLDAFPVRRFERTEAGWREIAVTFSPGNSATESLLPEAPLPDSSVFRHPFQPGQRVEVNEAARAWFQSWLPLWKSGRMLTLDYGSADIEALYFRRPAGTLRAYLLHQRLDGSAIYEHPGRQDITADVNFRDVIAWTEKFARSAAPVPFADFLRRWVPDDTGGPLSDPDGAGGAFVALEQEPA